VSVKAGCGEAVLSVALEHKKQIKGGKSCFIHRRARAGQEFLASGVPLGNNAIPAGLLSENVEQAQARLSPA
jgi:hypothetical protein